MGVAVLCVVVEASVSPRSFVTHFAAPLFHVGSSSILMCCLLGFFDGDGVASYVGVFLLCGDE